MAVYESAILGYQILQGPGTRYSTSQTRVHAPREFLREVPRIRRHSHLPQDYPKPPECMDTSRTPNNHKSSSLRKPQYLLRFQHIWASDSRAISITSREKTHPVSYIAFSERHTTKKSPKVSPERTPKIQPKSLKIQVWVPRCAARCLI